MENKTIKRILTAVTVILMVIGVVISSISIYHGDYPDEQQSLQLGIVAYNKVADPDGDGVANVEPEKTVDQFEEEEVTRVKGNINSAASTSIGWAVMLTYLTIGVWIIFILLGIIKNPKGLVKSGVTFGAFFVLILILYFTSQEAEIPLDLEERLTANNVKHDLGGYNLSSWGIATSFVLIALAIAAWIGGGIYSILKKS